MHTYTCGILKYIDEDDGENILPYRLCYKELYGYCGNITASFIHDKFSNDIAKQIFHLDIRTLHKLVKNANGKIKKTANDVSNISNYIYSFKSEADANVFLTMFQLEKNR